MKIYKLPKEVILILLTLVSIFSCNKEEIEPTLFNSNIEDILLGNSQYDINELETPLIDWSDKRVIWLGTSIPENQHGDGENISEKLENSYPAILGRLIDCVVINNSRRGTASSLDSDGTIQRSGSLSAYISEYEDPILNNENVSITGGENNRNTLKTFENSLLNQNGDFYVFDLIPNNESFDTSEWDKFNFETNTFIDGSLYKDNRKTYLGSILFLYNELMNDNPMAKIIFVTEFDTEHSGVQNTILASSQLNVPMVNLRELIIERGNTYETFDGIHPMQVTVDLLGEILFEEFSNMRIY